MSLDRFLCCCYLTIVLATTSMAVQFMDMQIQTWRKWTTTWREKVCVNQQTTCCVSGCSMIDSHYIYLVSLCLFYLKESLCGQRGLLPNTDTQTFQVSLTNRLRLQYDRIREPISRVCTVFLCVFNWSIKYTTTEKKFNKMFKTAEWLLVTSASEERAIEADGCRLG